MLSHEYKIAYVSSVSDLGFNSIVDHFKIKIKIIHIKDLVDLFLHISEIGQLDLIILDFNHIEINDARHMSISEIISSIVTFLRLVKEETSIAIAVFNDKDLEISKHIASNEIQGIIPIGPEYSTSDTIVALTEFLSGKEYTYTHLNKKTASSNAIGLTNRQQQIADIVCNRGISNKVIAKMLDITESTVKLHMTTILKKYGVRNRTQLALCVQKEKSKSNT